MHDSYDSISKARGLVAHVSWCIDSICCGAFCLGKQLKRKKVVNDRYKGMHSQRKLTEKTTSLDKSHLESSEKPIRTYLRGAIYLNNISLSGGLLFFLPNCEAEEVSLFTKEEKDYCLSVCYSMIQLLLTFSLSLFRSITWKIFSTRQLNSPLISMNLIFWAKKLLAVVAFSALHMLYTVFLFLLSSFFFFFLGELSSCHVSKLLHCMILKKRHGFLLLTELQSKRSWQLFRSRNVFPFLKSFCLVKEHTSWSCTRFLSC